MHLTRLEIRYIGALGALFMAGIYYLIGIGFANVGTTTSGSAPDLAVFGFGAGTAFLTIAALLAFTDRRWLEALMLIFQVLVFLMYIGVSGTRAPAFEFWGITLRVIQLLVIATLLYLTFARPMHATSEAQQ